MDVLVYVHIRVDILSKLRVSVNQGGARRSLWYALKQESWAGPDLLGFEEAFSVKY